LHGKIYTGEVACEQAIQAGLKTVGHARASLILANNFLPLNVVLYISRRVYEIIKIVFNFIINIWMLKHKPHGFI
jgi:hypothetical protein